MTQGRRFKKKWLLLGFVCCGAVIFHQPLLLFGCKVAIKRALPGGKYGTLQWENGVIALSGLSVKDSNSEFMVDRIELKFAGDLFRLRFAPEVVVVHPQIAILESGSNEPLNPIFLYRTRFFQPVWTVKNGVLQLPASRFYFSAVPGDDPAISKLNISYDPDLLAAPMLAAEMEVKEGKLEVGFKLQERDFGRLLPLASLLLPGTPREWDSASGEIEMEGQILLSEKVELEALQCHGLGKEIVLSGPKMGFKLLCDAINGSFAFPSGDMQLDASGALVQENSQLQFSFLGKGGVQDDATLWSQGSLVLTSIDGDELSSEISLCSLEGADLAILAKLDNITPAHLNFISGMHGSLGECIEGRIAAEATLLYKEGRWESLSIEKCTLDKVRWSFPSQEFMVFSESGNFSCDAVFSDQNIHLKILGDELLFSNPQGQLSVPKADRPMQFSRDVISKKWSGVIPLVHAHLHHKDLNLSLQNIEGNLILEEGHLLAPSLYAECEGLALTGNLDLAETELNISTSQIAGDIKSLFSILSKFHPLPKGELPIQGNFSSEDKGFVLSYPLNPNGNSAEWSFKGRFDGLNFPVNETTGVRDASCSLAIDSKSKSLVIEKGQGIWDLRDGRPLSIELKRFTADLFGERSVNFALVVQDGKKDLAWLEGIATELPNSGWDIAFEKKATHLAGIELNIDKCTLSQDIVSLDMKPILRCQDIQANAAFLQNTGFLTASFSPENLQQWQLEGTLETRVFSEDLTKGYSFELESHDLKVKGEPVASFQISGKKTGEKWQIEKLHAGAFDLKGSVISGVDGFSSPSFEGTWNGLALKGSGLLKTEKKRFSCVLESVKGDLSVLKVPNATKGTFITALALTGDFSSLENPLVVSGEANVFVDLQSPLLLTASNREAIKFSYNKMGGLVCSGIDLQLKHKLSSAHIAELAVAKVSHSDKGLNFQQMQFHARPSLWGYAIDAKILPKSLKELAWEGDLELSGDLQLSASGPVFLGNLKPGIYGYEGKNYPFEQIQLRYEKELFSIRAKAGVEELPLWASFQMDLFKEQVGMLKLYDHPKSEGLKILFRAPDSKIAIESVQGNCYGFQCSLVKNTQRTTSLATVLTGNIQVGSDKLTDLFPKTIREGIQNLKLGGGYSWAGDLVLFQDAKKGFSVNGTLTGRDFEFFGYRFHRMESTLEACQDSAILSNLKIEDPAGSIRIKNIELKKKADWNLFIPQVVVKDLQPSLMQKVGAEPSPLKPFTIKNFTLSDIRFRVGDKSSLEGSGQLMFVNQFKKGSSIFDAPLEMIKKLGLDLGILTPVQGELQMELRGDKFYLVSLDNSFSEGNRSEFYLFPEKNISYIDLDGKMHIDLKLRQDVVLKLAEPFTLTIRGTLENPRYGLQF